MQLSFIDLQHKLNIEYAFQFETCPVGGHNMHGKVERNSQLERIYRITGYLYYNGSP